MCETIKKQARSHTETPATKNTQRMYKLCRGSEFPKHVLPRATETPQTHIYFNKKGKTIPLGKRAARFIYRD